LKTQSILGSMRCFMRALYLPDARPALGGRSVHHQPDPRVSPVVAGLKDVRMQDLRHSFASFLVNAGRSLYEVQKILGHTQVKTTQRYAHLAQETLLDATNAVAGLLGDVVPVAKPVSTQIPAA
jgi:site-specific recombinase XerD